MTRLHTYQCPRCGHTVQVASANAQVTCAGRINHLGVIATHRPRTCQLINQEGA